MIDTLSIRSAYRGKELPETTIQILCDEIDRLRKSHAVDECNKIRDAAAAPRDIDEIRPAVPPQGKTVDVRVQVVVHPDGRWWAGSDFREEKRISRNDGEAQYWLTATLPVPAEVEVVARVEGE